MDTSAESANCNCGNILALKGQVCTVKGIVTGETTTACADGAVVIGTECLCDNKIAPVGSFCNSTGGIVTPKCVNGLDSICTVVNGDCPILSTGCHCNSIVGVAGQTCKEVGHATDEALVCEADAVVESTEC